MMKTIASLNTNQPKLKTGNEIWALLGVEKLLFLRKCEILNKSWREDPPPLEPFQRLKLPLAY